MQSKPDSWWTYLTSMFDIATRYMLYVRRERTGCIVPDFPIQYLYTKTAIMHRSITELCRLTSFLITWWKHSFVHVETTVNYGQVWYFISIKPARPLNILTHSRALLAAILSLCSLGITINCSVGITISCSLLAFPLSVSLASMLPLLLSISNS